MATKTAKQHKVHIRRKENSTTLPPEIKQEMVMRMGSVLSGRGPLKGVTGEKEKQLLPQIIDIRPDDRDFREQARNFWASLTIKVDIGGEVLNITTDEDGNPENPEDYVKYLWAQKHPKVAKTRLEMQRHPNKWFYIYDPREEEKKKHEAVQHRKKAYTAFINVSDDIEEVRMLLRNMGTLNPDSLSDQQAENELEKAAREEPKEFLKYATDKNRKVRNMILRMIDAAVLKRVGNAIYHIDDLIGNDMSEAIKFFRNKKNTETVNTLRAKFKEATK